MPDILAKIEEGVSHEEIVRALNEEGGLNLNFNTFRSYLYRYRAKIKQSSPS